LEGVWPHFEQEVLVLSVELEDEAILRAEHEGFLSHLKPGLAVPLGFPGAWKRQG
jgi:hypothetical protein